MRTHLRVVAAVLVVAAVAAVVAATSTWLARELFIDRCLDLGGAWRYEQDRCDDDGSRPDPRRNPRAAV